MHLLYDPAIPYLDIYPRERKHIVHTKICMGMFIANFFIIAPNWKQVKCLSQENKQIVVYPYNGILFGDKKRKNLSNTKCE